ncbi:helix-turn-helix transcriptional regulator [Pelagibius litoralis]|uniref:Helix-turn-helix transcriptional regulator n=1 Tax=Pelagibius litoralis TaxID=374515 RepID=A0A967F3A6_9PROT|nr:helix-turn-helix transcriptional regulator [Pelagibius litoralis]NIA72429.1 helix-turn-helix transcriptional regulator [Pelagibius litoralis]
MLEHQSVWRAIDRLAARYGLSPSGLARQAGLDPTTFNKSKRITKEGKQRWPSTESLAKVLNATGASLSDFVSLVENQQNPTNFRRLPKLRFALAAQPGYFDPQGRPLRAHWEETAFPDVADPHAFALEITGDGLQPIFRQGDIVVVSPSAEAGPGDRVLVRTQQGEMLIVELQNRNERELWVKSLGREQAARSLPASQIQWVSRISWAGH